MESFDAIVVGAGPAGLSAALILGRCRRRILVCDAGSPQNAASHALHGFLSRDGIEPAELLRLAREQLGPYQTVELRHGKVTDAHRSGNGFVLTLKDNVQVYCRKLLLATGVVDHVPEIDGLGPLYGRSVFHCPYCDGWEMRDQPIAVYGRGDKGLGLALELTQWSDDLLLCSDGPSQLSEEDLQRLARHKIQLREERIKRLEGADGALREIVFATGARAARTALFFSTGQHQRSDLAEKLGCEITEQGCIETGNYETTNVPGVYAAGDASRMVQLVVVAAAEGAQAAFAINQELLKEDLD
jgi:thioredoxin reductase